MTPPDPDFAWTLEHQLPRTPFGDAWSAHAGAARADDGAQGERMQGERVMIITLAPELVALAADRVRLAAALGARVGMSALPDTFAPLLDVLVAADGAILLLLPLEVRAPASERLERSRTFATGDIAEAARTIGAALDAAHAASPVAMHHGALAPGMVYLGEGQPARVIGLGLVDAFVEAGAPRDLVLAALDARHYAAPELVHVADDVAPPPATAAADVYALGATLYACMTGRPPFGGRTTAMIMANVLADEGLTGEVPAIPRDAGAAAAMLATQRLTQALLRAVERAPEDRWPTAGDFVAGLDGRVPSPSPMLLEPPSARARLGGRARSALRAFLQHGFLARLLPGHELR